MRNKSFSGSLIDKIAGRSSSRIFRAMVTLLIGSGLAKVIGLISIPIITRLYIPEDFGVMAVFTAVVAILAPVLTFSYHLAVPLPKQDSVAATVVWLSFLLSAVGGLVLTVLLWAYSAQVLSAFSVDALIPDWWLIVIGILGFASFETLSMWATRERDFGQLSRLKVRQSLFGNLVKIAAGVVGAGPIGLMVGAIVGKSSGTLSLFAANRGAINSGWSRLTLRRMIAVAKRYSSFPRFRFPANQLTAVSVHLPVIFISATYGVAVAGQYGLTILVIALPVTLLSGSMAKAFFGEATVIAREDPERLQVVTRAIMKRMFLVSVVPAALLGIFGPELFHWVFGPAWAQAGDFARYLSPLLLVQLIANSVQFTFAIARAEDQYFRFALQRAILIVIFLLISSSADLLPHVFISCYALLLTAHYMRVIWCAAIIRPGRV